MRITDGQGTIPPRDWSNRRTERPGTASDSASRAKDAAPAQETNAASASADPAAPKPTDAVHKESALRESVAELIESGDISAAEDSAVRRARIDDARKKLEAGTYDRNDIIGGIVDRLLSQWKL